MSTGHSKHAGPEDNQPNLPHDNDIDDSRSHSAGNNINQDDQEEEDEEGSMERSVERWKARWQVVQDCLKWFVFFFS